MGHIPETVMTTRTRAVQTNWAPGPGAPPAFYLHASSLLEATQAPQKVERPLLQQNAPRDRSAPGNLVMCRESGGHREFENPGKYALKIQIQDITSPEKAPSEKLWVFLQAFTFSTFKKNYDVLCAEAVCVWGGAIVIFSCNWVPKRSDLRGRFLPGVAMGRDALRPGARRVAGVAGARVA